MIPKYPRKERPVNRSSILPSLLAPKPQIPPPLSEMWSTADFVYAN